MSAWGRGVWRSGVAMMGMRSSRRGLQGVSDSQNQLNEAALRLEADAVLDRGFRRVAALLVGLGAAFYYVRAQYDEKGRYKYAVEEGSDAKDGKEKDTSEESSMLVESAMSHKEWRPFVLKDSQDVSHNTRIYRFALPEASMTLGMPVASFIMLRTPPDSEGKQIARPYTPISSRSTHGHFDLMIKTYEQGNVSKHVATLGPGDTMEMKGPFVKMQYVPNMIRNIGMIAGGTGITPMYQMIEEILGNPLDKTVISLVYANVTPRDILLKNKLDSLAKQHPDRFRVHYVVEKAPPSNRSMSKGYVTKEIISEHLPSPKDNSLIFVCGPPPMLDAIAGPKHMNKQGKLKGALKEIGFESRQVFKF